MKVRELNHIINGTLVCGAQYDDREVKSAFASDLMSDVLTINADQLVLITGLANVQAIRTAEMSDISVIVVARNKSVTEDMINLAKVNEIVLITCTYSVYKTSGLLYESGLKPLY